MTVYLQGPNGEEIELVVTEPDPPDGTFVAQAEGTLPEGWWIRIVPEDKEKA